MMNKVFLIGNLTRDPELSQTPSGISCCRFGLAVSRAYTSGDGERQTDFFDCTAWRGLGETIAKYSKKGNKLAIMGSIQLRNYEDNKGIKRTAVDIIVNDVEFLTPKADGSESGNSEPIQGRINTTGKKPTLQEVDDDLTDDIPF